MGRLLHFL